MKKYLLFFALLLLCSTVSAQNESEYFYDEDSLSFKSSIIDTLDTDDKFVKVLLFEDHTWEYLDLGRPELDTAGFYDEWDEGNIHAYKDVKVSDLPEVVDLTLVDENNSYCAPITGKVYSKFRWRRRRAHRGVDIPHSIGDTVRAPFNGAVRIVMSGKKAGGYGNVIVLRHTNGLETYYGHLSKINVEPGELVKAGEIIGLVGNSGRSTGPHLHFETRYMGQSFDPERIIEFETGALRDTVLSLKRHYFNINSHYGQTDDESKKANERVVHTVKKGDTLGRIAGKYGTTVSSICKLNGISSKKVLSIGMRLIVR